jgi:hypothetical protein
MPHLLWVDINMKAMSSALGKFCKNKILWEKNVHKVIMTLAASAIDSWVYHPESRYVNSTVPVLEYTLGFHATGPPEDTIIPTLDSWNYHVEIDWEVPMKM